MSEQIKGFNRLKLEVSGPQPYKQYCKCWACGATWHEDSFHFGAIINGPRMYDYCSKCNGVRPEKK